MAKHERKTKGGALTQRQLRVGEDLRHILSEVISRGSLPNPLFERAIITISEVRVSPDLRHALVYVMPLGGQNIEAVLAALKESKNIIRKSMGHRLTMKYTPDLRFAADETFDEAERIEALLRRVKPAISEEEEDESHVE